MTTTFDLQRMALAIDGTAVEKHVLLVLATRADGSKHQCTPGVPRIASDTGLSERTILRAVSSLEAAKHITRAITEGVGTVYTIHPRPSVTPDTESPLTDSHVTPDTESPKQPRTPIPFKKAALSQKKRASKPRFILPSDIPADEWAGFEEMRKSIRKPMTDSIRDKAIARLRKLAEHGYPPGDVLSHSTLNSYQGLFPPKDDRNGSNRQGSSSQSQRVDGFAAALRQVAGS